MKLSVEQELPSTVLTHMTADGPKDVNLVKMIAGKKVVLIGMPGAFTQTCTTSHLPSFIRNSSSIFNVPDDFDSRFSAIERRYSYVIYNSKNKPLFFDTFSYWVTNNLEINIIKNQLNMFLGHHDFSSFRSSSCNSKNHNKNISYVDKLKNKTWL